MMDADEDVRTLWCGNLSERVTEDILYELFLQGGPVQRVTIPKDRDGRQRAFGFITFKHVNSVSYAIELFDGTTLFNRIINIKARNPSELQRTDRQPQEMYNVNDLLLLGQQMCLGNFLPNGNTNKFGTNMIPNNVRHNGKSDVYSYQEDRRHRRMHPYQRDYERDFPNDKKDSEDWPKDNRLHRRKNEYRPSDHSRHDNYKSHRHNYH